MRQIADQFVSTQNFIVITRALEGFCQREYKSSFGDIVGTEAGENGESKDMTVVLEGIREILQQYGSASDATIPKANNLCCQMVIDRHIAPKIASHRNLSFRHSQLPPELVDVVRPTDIRDSVGENPPPWAAKPDNSYQYPIKVKDKFTPQKSDYEHKVDSFQSVGEDVAASQSIDAPPPNLQSETVLDRRVNGVHEKRNVFINAGFRDIASSINSSRYSFTIRFGDQARGMPAADLVNVTAIRVTSLILPTFHPNNLSAGASTINFLHQCLLVNLDGFTNRKYISTGMGSVSSVLMMDHAYSNTKGRSFLVFKPAHDESIDLGTVIKNISTLSVDVLTPAGRKISSASDGANVVFNVIGATNNTMMITFADMFDVDSYMVGDRVTFRNLNIRYQTGIGMTDIFVEEANRWLNRMDGHEIVAMGPDQGSGTYNSFTISYLGDLKAGHIQQFTKFATAPDNKFPTNNLVMNETAQVCFTIEAQTIVDLD